MKNVPIIMLTAGLLLAGAGCKSPQVDEIDSMPVVEQTYHVETHADRLLREMGDYLKSADAFTVHAESSYDAIDQDGQQIRYGGSADVALRRPDGFRFSFNGDERQRQAFFDGKTVTYAVTEVPPVIDDAIDTLFDKYGVSVPLSDLLYEDPYGILIPNVLAGRWVGRHSIDGVPCNHLAFTQELIDWQIWIEDGAQPVPRQVLIVYKDEPGWPQYIARMKDWDFEPQFSDDYFQFQPPAGSDVMEFLVTSEMEANDE
ncbi:MAG: DUF2092 domain-containing protein [Planctomycetota bacterium]|jgi:hypothetical protein